MGTDITTEIKKYCPQCVGERPKKLHHQNPLNQQVSVPEICPAHQAENRQLKAESIADGKVKVKKIAFGESARPKEEHQKSLLNLTGRHGAKTNRSRNQPP